MTTRTALTGAQTGVWYAQQVLHGSADYNVGQYVDLPGDIDPVLFEAALRRAVRETETLRARIVAEDGPHGAEDAGTPVQEIHPDPSWDLAVLDLRSADDPRGAALEWMHEQMSTPIWGTGRLLFTFALLRVADHHWMWFQRYHHILVDAYAINMVNRRVAQIYTHGNGQSTPAPRSRTLAEVVAEEQAYAASERKDQDRQYWTRTLEGRPEPAVLGT
ncbi:condensation domain-containing protein, partial [Nocardiopsis salina]|uniref:condensation domain-containing protein n=1 Tax=Nocardiopsis salina TaxID=245836 RepID=UPI0019552924